MTYPHLPAVGTLAVPPLPFRRSPNQSLRRIRTPRVVFVHRWGGGSFDGVTAWLSKGDSEPGAGDGSQASAHVVYAGEVGPAAGRAVQLVAFAAKAWTECTLNDVGVSIECADAIWTGHDPEGFARLARIVALLCARHLDACRPLTGQMLLAGSHGFARHADAGALGCGHLYCPTADEALWRQFAGRVVAEYRHGGFRPAWGK